MPCVGGGAYPQKDKTGVYTFENTHRKNACGNPQCPGGCAAAFAENELRHLANKAP